VGIQKEQAHGSVWLWWRGLGLGGPSSRGSIKVAGIAVASNTVARFLIARFAGTTRQRIVA